MERAWKERYPLSKGHRIPRTILETAPKVIPVVVKTLLWTPYPELGGKKMVDLVSYSKRMHRAVQAGSRRLLKGSTPADLPKRLIISAGVYAFRKEPDRAKQIRSALLKALDGPRDSIPVTTPAVIRKPIRSAGRKKIVIIHRLPRRLPVRRRIHAIRPRRRRRRPRPRRIRRLQGRHPSMAARRSRVVTPLKFPVMKAPSVRRKRHRSATRTIIRLRPKGSTPVRRQRRRKAA